MARSDTAKLWEERLRRFDQAQTTVAQFCATEGVSQPSYYHWRRKLRGPAARPAAKAKPNMGAAAPHFIPVALGSEPQAPEAKPKTPTGLPCASTTIELPGGIRIRVEVPAVLHDRKLSEGRS